MNDALRARYYEERQKGADLEQVAKRCLCECGADLTVWFKSDADGVNIYHLRCGNGHVDPAMVPQASVYELWREGKIDVPIYVANQYEKRLEREEKRNANHRQGFKKAI